MSELTGIAKTIYDEIMDEIDEEIKEAFEGTLSENLIGEIIQNIQEASSPKVTEIITKYYTEEMDDVKKLILGERAARVVTAITKDFLRDVVSRITKNSFDVLDELRNEIIGEVFEETE